MPAAGLHGLGTGMLCSALLKVVHHILNDLERPGHPSVMGPSVESFELGREARVLASERQINLTHDAESQGFWSPITN